MISIEDLKALEGKAIYLDLLHTNRTSSQYIGKLQKVTLCEYFYDCHIVLWHPIICVNYGYPLYRRAESFMADLCNIKECRPLNLIEQLSFVKQTYHHQPLTMENTKTFFYSFPNIKPYDNRRT